MLINNLSWVVYSFPASLAGDAVLPPSAYVIITLLYINTVFHDPA